MKPIPYGKQQITQQDIDAVTEALHSDFLTQGPRIKEFEDAFARYVDAPYAVAVSNGTAALHLGALAFGVKPGDKVITSAMTFSASANCVRYCGGEVVFIDVDPATLLIDIRKVKELLTQSPKGTYQGIIPVDFAGKVIDGEAFRQLADEFGLWIMEDACHAPGGHFVDGNGVKQKCGNSRFSQLTVFSFHPVKHIASGEGGMITTRDQNLYEKLMTLRTHGIVRDQNLFQNPFETAAPGEAKPASGQYPGWYMEMQTLGFNYRITDFQAALGSSQLKRADEGLARRRAIAKRYDEAFRGHPHIKSQLNELKAAPSGHAYHLYVVEVLDRLRLYNYLREHNIFTQVHYLPVHLMPYYQEQGWKQGDMPHAEKYYSGCLSLPMFPSLTDEELEYVIEKIIGFYR